MEYLSSSVCRSCRTRLSTINTARAFSTSQQRQIVPPESPAYIDIPSTFQTDLSRPRREKGILPVPRQLFPQSRPDKASPQYLDNLAKPRSPQNEVSYESLSEQGKYRYRMSELRKKHIREGLTELHKRKVLIDTKNQRRSKALRAERARLVAQPEREDARLTNNTVPKAIHLAKSSTPIADDLAAAKAQYERKLANYNATLAAKSEERLDALHTLYMNAREFITTEEQLNKTIDAVFDETRVFRSYHSEGKSMWNKGPPDTIRAMIENNRTSEPVASHLLNTMRGTSGASATTRFNRDQERMKKIAEKLSGGKI